MKANNAETETEIVIDEEKFEKDKYYEYGCFPANASEEFKSTFYNIAFPEGYIKFQADRTQTYDKDMRVETRKPNAICHKSSATLTDKDSSKEDIKSARLSQAEEKQALLQKYTNTFKAPSSAQNNSTCRII